MFLKKVSHFRRDGPERSRNWNAERQPAASRGRLIQGPCACPLDAVAPMEGASYNIMDDRVNIIFAPRDCNFFSTARDLFKCEGARTVKLSPRAPTHGTGRFLTRSGGETYTPALASVRHG